MKYLIGALFLLLALPTGAVAGAWLYYSWPRIDVTEVTLTEFESAPTGEVRFASWDAFSAKDLFEGPSDAPPAAGFGMLYLPDEASVENPVPAMIIMHGAGGDWTGSVRDLAQRLSTMGIAGLAVDTYQSRGITRDDSFVSKAIRASIYSQVVDSLQALKALSRHPHIDPERIGVAGFSLGGVVSLYAMHDAFARPVVGDGPRFAAHAAFYGGCSFELVDYGTAGAPTLIMLGEKDDSIAIAPCRKMVSRLNAQGVDARLTTYPTAGHGWNESYPFAFQEDAFHVRDCTPSWDAKGNATEKTSGLPIDNMFLATYSLTRCGGYGYHMGWDEAATAQSWRDLIGFLTDVWNLDASAP